MNREKALELYTKGKMSDIVFGNILLKDSPQLSQEQIDFIKNLSHEMKTQDNRGTAQPYGLIIGQKKKQITDYDDATHKAIHWIDCEYDSYAEFIDALKGYYDEDGNSQSAISYIYDTCEDIDDIRREEYSINALLNDRISVYGYEVVSDYSPGLCGGNFFMTDKSAKAYIESNRHNLNQPYTYGIHLYRNHEMKNLYEIIHKLAEVL